MSSSRNLGEEPADNGSTANLEKDKKEQRSPPGPAPVCPVKFVPVTAVSCVSSLIAASKCRDCLEFPLLPIGAQHAL